MSVQKHKKIVLVFCVVTWAGIFFLSGTLFVRRRYDIGMANEVVSKLSSSLQEQIDNLSSEINEGKTSALDLTRALHKKINLTLSTLDNKIIALEKEFAEKRQLALHALNALHRGTSDTKDEKPGEHSRTLETRGPIEIKSSASQTCIDSMEQSVGSDVELFECHGQERNQAWRHHDSNRLIENKAIEMCLRADGGSDGSLVKTASCDENDPQQKWIRSRLSFILDDGAQESKCLDTDSENRKLVVKLCDSTKESQHWTY